MKKKLITVPDNFSDGVDDLLKITGYSMSHLMREGMRLLVKAIMRGETYVTVSDREALPAIYGKLAERGEDLAELQIHDLIDERGEELGLQELKDQTKMLAAKYDELVAQIAELSPKKPRGKK